MPTPPNLTDATDELAGRTCPYCQTGVSVGEAIAQCGDCAAVQHAECWTENVGCAVTGCASAPDPSAVPQAVLPSEGVASGAPGRLAIAVDGDGSGTMTAVREAPATLAPVGLPPAPRRRWPIALAVAGLFAVFGGGAVALSSGDDATTSVAGPPAVEPASAPADGDEAPVPSSTTAPAQREPALASVSSLGACGGLVARTRRPTGEAPVEARLTTIREVDAAVVAYLNAIRDGDRDAAYECLTPAARGWFLQGGDDDASRSNWWKTQQPLRAGLGPQTASTVIATPKSVAWLSDATVRINVPRVAWRGNASCSPGGWLWATLVNAGGTRRWAIEPAIRGFVPGTTMPTRLRKAQAAPLDDEDAPNSSFYPDCLAS